MNRRNLMQSVLAVLTLGLLPRKRKATKEELNRLLNTAVNRYIQDNPEKFVARFDELFAQMVYDTNPGRCAFAPDCAAPKGSMCARCISGYWRSTVSRYEDA